MKRLEEWLARGLNRQVGWMGKFAGGYRVVVISVDHSFIGHSCTLEAAIDAALDAAEGTRK